MFGRVHDADTVLESLGLTAFQRKIIRLHAVEGLTLEQIGWRYGVIKTTVHRWIYLIRKKCGDRAQEIFE